MAPNLNQRPNGRYYGNEQEAIARRERELDNVSDSTLGQSQYNFNSRSFPEDLGAGNPHSNGDHYMVININVQNRSSWNQATSPSGVSQDYYTRLPGELSKADVLRYNIDPRWQTASSGGASGFDNGNIQQNITNFAQNLTTIPGQSGLTSLSRGTTRIAESIALFVPANVEYVQRNTYEEVKLAEMAKGGLSGALNGAGNGGLGVIARGLGLAVDVAGRTAQLLGAPINPRVEYLYVMTPNRKFVFDFLFAPETESESLALENIIRTLRFHAAPEFDSQNLGLTMTPPSEFDITWYHKGQENTSIPRINTVLLEQIDLNYAPSGMWATFSNGYPAAVRMQLSFIETDVVTKQRVAQGF